MAEDKALVQIDQRALAEFEVTPEQVAERVKEFENLHLVPADPKSYKHVKGAYMTIVHLRNKVDARRKELGEEARKWTNALSAAAKKLVAPTAPLEARRKLELDREDTRLAVIEAEKVQKEKDRVDGILAKISTLAKRGVIDPATPLSELNALFLDTFELEITEGEYMEHAALASNTKALAIHNIKAGISKREEWEKGEADRKLEAERLDKVRKEQEAESKRLEEMERKIAEETAKFNAERRAEEQRWRDEADAKAKAEQEAIEQADKERKLKEAAEYQDRIQPDKKKIISYVHGILDHARPQIMEPKASTTFEWAVAELKKWANEVIEIAKKL